MTLINHAKKEFRLLGLHEKYDILTQEAVLELIRVFSKRGHSETSALYTLEIFQKLAKYEILSPLTGNDDEWNQVDSFTYQNNRCSTVFKSPIMYNTNNLSIHSN